MKLREKYGDIFTLNIGAETFIVLNGNKLINELYVKRGNLFSARPDNYFVQGLVKHSGNYFKIYYCKINMIIHYLSFTLHCGVTNIGTIRQVAAI